MAAIPSALPASERRGRDGRGEIVVRRRGGTNAVIRAHATSPLRFVRPTFPSCDAAAVCLVTFGGGLVGGDAIDVAIVVERGATALVFTQSSTKVFRGRSQQRVSARVEGTLVLMPDPVAAFAGAHYTQRIEIALAGDGGCVLVDGFTSGRAAFGERWAMDGLDLATVITHDGRLLVRDALRLERGDGSLARRMGRFEAASTILAAGRVASAVVADVGAGEPTIASDLVVAAGPLPSAERIGVPGAVARVFATSPSLAQDTVRSRLRNLPDIGAVDPFTSRY